jgi:hypothetical protein
MYIFQLMGGLGNQMFQYAAGHSLAAANNNVLKVDFDCPYQHIKYSFNLGVFKLKAEHASSGELWKCKPKRKVIKRLFMLTGQDPSCKLVSEKKDFVFDPDFFSIPDGSYVRGFFQSEKYFKPVETSLREDFAFTTLPAGKNKAYADSISNEQAVSLHIRRGDYVNVPETNQFHGVCSISYYQQAIELIASKVEHPVFYIFSDDMQWVKNNFNIVRPHIFVEGNDAATNFEDLRLMSLCSHHIIANSSFSWWGAWLNPVADKIVIAPKQWMKDPGFNTPDLIPETWVRL